MIEYANCCVEQSWELQRAARAAGLRVALARDSRLAPSAPLGMFREAVLLDLACPHAQDVLQKVKYLKNNHLHYVGVVGFQSNQMQLNTSV